MKEADLDWLVYHILLEFPDLDQEALATRTGSSDEDVAASLSRLESAFLVIRRGGLFRASSVPEMMLACQCKYDTLAPFYVENGVIREKKGPG